MRHALVSLILFYGGVDDGEEGWIPGADPEGYKIRDTSEMIPSSWLWGTDVYGRGVEMGDGKQQMRMPGNLVLRV